MSTGVADFYETLEKILYDKQIFYYFHTTQAHDKHPKVEFYWVFILDDIGRY